MITLRDLGKSFAGDWIFRHVGFEIPKHGSVALIGPSGSGKSVLLKIIAGLLHEDEGKVILGSRNVGMLFQKNALFDSLTVEENLLFPLRERKGIKGAIAKERARYFLEEVGLRGSEGLFPDEISGGMQKRLGIARALIVEPEIILYDEPTAGLDPITSKKIADLIVRLRQESGCTVLAVTNDVHRAYQMGDRILLLGEGRLVDGGTPDEVRKTRNPMLRQFVFGLKHGPLTSMLEEETVEQGPTEEASGLDEEEEES